MFSFANKLMIVTTALVCIVQMVYWYDKLPLIVPSHFDGQGNVDGEMGRGAFYALFAGMHLLFLGGFLVLAHFLKKLPDSMINCPNKDYWLAPERREQSVDFNAQFLVATGWITSWLMIGCFQLSALVGIGKRNSIEPEFVWMIGLYLAVIIVMCVGLFLRFQKPNLDSSDFSSTSSETNQEVSGNLEPTN